tara:strand:+ start:363 stop:1289 length:927 start_codon:yes stop_codon:yes gene_type:complete
MKRDIRRLATKLLKGQNFDCLSVGVIDFKSSDYNCLENILDKKLTGNGKNYFDLASLTKPLTLGSFCSQKPDAFNENKGWELLLNHRAGLPAWGRLKRYSWKEQIMSYEVLPSITKYSDFSALRLMLEIEKAFDSKFENVLLNFWDKETLFWKNLSQKNIYPKTGHRNGDSLRGVVHDDNAFVINEFCTHAGLFSTIDGLCRTLINLDKRFCLLEHMKKGFQKRKNGNRFVNGWDTVDIKDGKESLAGRGCGPFTFGHLGFTGTSIWIDIEKGIGFIILTNATRDFWYDRTRLNNLRKEIGRYVWAYV